MWYAQGDLGQARTVLTRALDIARAVGETEMVVQAENLFGYIEHAAGNFHDARDWFTRSVEGFRALTIPWGTGNALSGLAGVALATDDAARAEHLADEAAAVLRQSGPWFLLMSLYVRALLEVRRGEPDCAILVIRDSLSKIRTLHDKFEFVYALVPLAAAAVLKGDDEWAARILGARDTVTERTGATVVDKSVHDLLNDAERGVRARLGPDRWAQCYAAGRKSSVDALLQDIDRALG